MSGILSAVSDARQPCVSVSVEPDTVHDPPIKRLKLMESDSETEDTVETASDELSVTNWRKNLVMVKIHFCGGK